MVLLISTLEYSCIHCRVVTINYSDQWNQSVSFFSLLILYFLLALCFLSFFILEGDLRGCWAVYRYICQYLCFPRFLFKLLYYLKLVIINHCPWLTRSENRPGEDQEIFHEWSGDMIFFLKTSRTLIKCKTWKKYGPKRKINWNSIPHVSSSLKWIVLWKYLSDILNKDTALIGFYCLLETPLTKKNRPQARLLS